jgi:ribosomal protein S18 acetylase RimI-like enzyme
LHINLLPRLRGRGTGHALLMRWLHAVRQLGSTGVHLAVGVNNTLAIQFYQAHGFIEPQGVLPVGPGARWLVLPLPR